MKVYNIFMLISLCIFSIGLKAQVNCTASCTDGVIENEDRPICVQIPNYEFLPGSNLPIKQNNYFPNYTGLKVVYIDDFNDVNLPDWIKDKGQAYSTGNIGVFIPENIEVSGGNLILKAKHENPGLDRKAIEYEPANMMFGCDDGDLTDCYPNLRTFHWSSSQVHSKFAFKYGVFEARIKIPVIRGVFPAFWLFGNGGEIDIFEFLQYYNENNTCVDAPSLASKRILATYHAWGLNYNCNGLQNEKADGLSKTDCGLIYSNNYHNFKVEWNEYTLSWYVDDVLIKRVYHYFFDNNSAFLAGVRDYNQIAPLIGNTQFYENPYYPKGAQHMIIDIGMNSMNGMGYPNGSNYTDMDLNMLVDWVKVSQYKTCNQDIVFDGSGELEYRTTGDPYNLCTPPETYTIDKNPLPSYLSGKTITISSISAQHQVNNLNYVFVNCDGAPNFRTTESGEYQIAELRATDEIRIKPGFQAMRGSYMHAKIDNSDCSFQTRMNNESITNTNEAFSQVFKDALEKDKKQLVSTTQPVSLTLPLQKYFGENPRNYFSIIPNPNSGKFSLQLNSELSTGGKLSVTITDMLGKTVYTSSIVSDQPNVDIDLNHQAAGVYYVQLHGDNVSEVKKIIIQ